MSVGTRSHLEHPAFLYGSRDDFLRVMVPYVQMGIDRGDVCFVAARGDYLPSLADEVDGGRVKLVDTYEWHPHPSTRLRAFSEMIVEELDAGSTSFRLAGEPVWAGNTPEFTKEWQRYESVLNSVLAPYPVSLICLYDTATLDPSVVDGARKTHPLVQVGEDVDESPDFRSPERFLPRWNHELPDVPTAAVRMTEVPDAAAGRRFLWDQALASGMEPEGAMDMCVAANEILTNGFVHAEHPEMAIWRDEARLICQIDNYGEPLDDALAGYRPPELGQVSGRGLWLARQLVDLLQIVPTAEGTSFRLYGKL